MTDIRAWQHAYAVQAKADFAASNILRQSPSLPQCLSLHCLQMACEKLCKSYLCSQKVEPRFLQASHAYTTKNLPEMFLRQRESLGLRSLRQYSTLMKQVRNLAREIELLAPTVDNQRRPDNCEYPWEDGAGNVVVPAEYSFAALSLLTEPAGQELLKILPFAIDELL